MPASKHLTYYGSVGLLTLLVTVAAFFILRDNSCVPIGAKNYDKLEPIQIAGAIAGGVLFILSFFNIANVLYDIKIVFFAVIVVILGLAGVMVWGAYIAFTEPCVASVIGLNQSVLSKNAFDAEAGHNIAVMVLDILAALNLLTIGCTFAKRL